jgi:nicotinamidase-related amidase
MSRVSYLKALADPSITPCLVLIDMQMEYFADPRLIALPNGILALDNCGRALKHARESGFPIAFLRQVSQSAFFNPTTTFSTWIDGFEPRQSDMVFERSLPSAYSSKYFAAFMEGCGGHFVLAGFAGETNCLSTAIDAYHRQHPFTYLSDASASHNIGNLSPSQTQDAVSRIVSLYGKVLSTQSWITGEQDLEFPNAPVPSRTSSPERR